MIPALTNHLWQSTLFGLAVAVWFGVSQQPGPGAFLALVQRVVEISGSVFVAAESGKSSRMDAGRADRSAACRLGRDAAGQRNHCRKVWHLRVPPTGASQPDPIRDVRHLGMRFRVLWF